MNDNCHLNGKQNVRYVSPQLLKLFFQHFNFAVHLKIRVFRILISHFFNLTANPRNFGGIFSHFSHDPESIFLPIALKIPDPLLHSASTARRNLQGRPVCENILNPLKNCIFHNPA